MPWNHLALCLLSPSQRSVVTIKKNWVCHNLMDVVNLPTAGHIRDRSKALYSQSHPAPAQIQSKARQTPRQLKQETEGQYYKWFHTPLSAQWLLVKSPRVRFCTAHGSDLNDRRREIWCNHAWHARRRCQCTNSEFFLIVIGSSRNMPLTNVMF